MTTQAQLVYSRMAADPCRCWNDGHAAMIRFHAGAPATLDTPEAILVISVIGRNACQPYRLRQTCHVL